MTDKEKIRAEVERQIDEVVNPDSKILRVLIDIRNFIDSLPEETNQTPSPDEAMKILNGKIALRRKNGSWEGTDAENFGR